MYPHETSFALASLFSDTEHDVALLDYAVLYDLISRHNLYNHALRLIERQKDVIWPASFVRQLESSSKLNQQYGLLHHYHLRQALAALSGAAVPAIPFKGTTLSASLYGSPTFRPSADIDLLVRQQDMVCSVEALAPLGFERLYRHTPTGQKDIALLHRSHQVSLELHHMLLEPGHFSGFDEAVFWERAQPTTLAGCTSLQLEAHDYFAYLCMHGVGHLGSMELKWLGDLVAFLEKVSNQTAFIRETFELNHLAPARRGMSIMLSVLNVVAERVGAKTPAPSIGSQRVRLTTYVLEHLFDQSDRPIWDKLRRKLYIAQAHDLSLIHI